MGGQSEKFGPKLGFLAILKPKTLFLAFSALFVGQIRWKSNLVGTYIKRKLYLTFESGLGV